MRAREATRVLPRGKGPCPPLPPDDAAWLEPMFDRDLLLGTLAPFAEERGVSGLDCRRLHVRYRPANYGVFLYEVTGSREEEEVSTLIHIKGAAVPREEPAPVGTSRGVLLDGPVLMGTGRHVVREYPDDETIPGLHRLADPAAFARELADGLMPDASVPEPRLETRVLRYKPDVRLILGCDLSWSGSDGEPRRRHCIVRFDTADGSRAGLDLSRRLSASLPSDAALMFPSADFVSADGHMTVASRLPGDLLAKRLRTGSADPDTRTAGRVLALFHRLPVADVPFRSTEEARRDLVRRAKPAKGYPAGFARTVQALLLRLEDALSREPAGPGGLVHGDAHPGQILIGDDGVVMLDLDRVHRGETAVDLGAWFAQHELLELRGKLDAAAPLNSAFLDAYAEAGGVVPPRRRLAVWTTVALLELALREMRRLKRDWPSRTSAILERCESWLGKEDGA